MSRNDIDLKKEFDNSWEKQAGIPYERWLENEIQKVENKKEEYNRFAYHMSLEANKLAGKLKRVFGVESSDGLLPCPFCGEYPKIIHPTENMPVVSIVHTGVGHRILLEFFSSEQEAIDEWNKRIKGEVYDRT